MAVRLTYNAKTIDFTGLPFGFRAVPLVPRTINQSITGVTEILTLPRVDIEIQSQFRPETSASKRVQFDNWWQWAQQGNAWTLALDSSKVVDTTITADAAAGATSVVVASNSGIVSGQTYKLMVGPYYQLVTVSGIAGTTISLATTSLDSIFLSGAVFRDQYFFRGVIRDPQATSPVQDVEADELQAFPLTRFRISMQFHESLT